MKIANYQMDELLEQVNTSPDPEAGLKQLINSNGYAKYFLDQAVNDKFVDINYDDMKYTFSPYHRSMAGAFLLSKSTSLVYEQVLLSNQAAVKTKEYKLKALFEMLAQGEAQILLAIIKKNLTELYPNITHEMICKVL